MTTPVYATPQEAESAFYDAFERANVEAMMNVWANDDSIVCTHPLGPSLRGRSAVEESWKRIFEGGAPMRFKITDTQYTQDNLLSVHCLYERIRFGQNYREISVVVATNIYTLTDNGWRMVLHHASPSPEVVDEQPSHQILH